MRMRKVIIEKTREKLFDVRNLIEGIRFVAEAMDDCDELKLVIQTAARIAVEKVDEVTGGVVFDPPWTERQIARKRAELEKRGNLESATDNLA